MKVLESIRKLCTPAYVYLVISAIAIISMMFQNAGATNKYCVGMFECQASNIPAIFVMKVIYVAFWTFVLDSICKAGHKRIAWFILLLPIILFFAIIGLGMIMAAGKGVKSVFEKL
tara:strand:- start:260 stop:607 length:348 start_codon:yes stop_codon:yes gene_type:complete